VIQTCPAIFQTVSPRTRVNRPPIHRRFIRLLYNLTLAGP
jgi:hypothetical protein